jgi:hypothetical protein
MHIRRLAPAVVAYLVALGICYAAGARAQDHDHHPVPAVLGDVHFPVSCTPAAQAKLNTAASLLYSFYWEKIDAAVA